MELPQFTSQSPVVSGDAASLQRDTVDARRDARSCMRLILLQTLFLAVCNRSRPGHDYVAGRCRLPARRASLSEMVEA